MNISEEERQRQDFRDILLSLADSQDMLKEAADRSKIYQRLEKLYYHPQEEKRFRHFYSDIFSVLTQVHQGDKPGSIDILGQNLGEIRKNYQAKNFDKQGNPIDISNSIRKLYDHVSMDIARISYSDAADRNISGEKIQEDLQAQRRCIDEEIKPKMSDVNMELQNIKKEYKTLRTDLANSQKEYVTILGIFAAIILAFTGGIVFSTSVLENMHSVSIYKAILVCLCIGLVFANVINILLEFIKDINKIPKEKNCRIFILNLLFILGIIFMLFAMKFHWFGSEYYHVVKFVAKA